MIPLGLAGTADLEAVDLETGAEMGVATARVCAAKTTGTKTSS